MGNANIPDDWTDGYKDYLVKWPDSEQWKAILRGSLTAPAFIEFWDVFSGDPSQSIEAMSETFDTNLHLEEVTVIPTGTIADFAGDVTPGGWLICDGSTISRVEYAELFSVIGETYGQGNGTTTFKIPECLGRVNVCRNPIDSDFDELGVTGGIKTVSLTSAQMPIHTHTQNSHNHTQEAHNHGVSPGMWMNENSGNNLVGNPAGSYANVGNPIAAATAVNVAATATNQNAGGGEGHSNLQPFIVFNRIIKV